MSFDKTMNIYSYEDIVNTYNELPGMQTEKGKEAILDYMSWLTGKSIDTLLEYIDIKNLPKEQGTPEKDTVSIETLKQVIWERDTAIGQLKELGYGFGEKINEDNTPGRWIDDCCSNCGVSKYNFFSFDFKDKNGYARPFGSWKFCPSCGKKMLV